MLMMRPLLLTRCGKAVLAIVCVLSSKLPSVTLPSGAMSALLNSTCSAPKFFDRLFNQRFDC